MEQIILKDVGRSHVNRTIDVPSRPDGQPNSEKFLQHFAYEAVCKYLMSTEVTIEADADSDTYDVIVGGLRKVGEVTIKKNT